MEDGADSAIRRAVVWTLCHDPVFLLAVAVGPLLTLAQMAQIAGGLLLDRAARGLQ